MTTPGDGRSTTTSGAGVPRRSPALLGGGLALALVGLAILLLGSSAIGVVLLVVGLALAAFAAVPRVWANDPQHPGD
ncbi:hypothetical protein [Patulibacter sp.]|uniref:hypothetical protein n=1 Tax=Patulibacter sp. TaxID=1912859 RepID=UPI002723B5F5|nr:hypothetical protein [Patulibacter sp.]MDO9407160.1 hypothetical protein [Patulibacter sp.]